MEEFFGNEINIDIEKVKIARINDVATTDSNQPIIATHDIKTCIAVLIICENEARMTHIETLDTNNYRTGLEKIKTMCQNWSCKIKVYTKKRVCFFLAIII